MRLEGYTTYSTTKITTASIVSYAYLVSVSPFMFIHTVGYILG
jgi:hypothetical protein